MQILTHWWRMFLSYRNRSIDLQRKSMNWFLYDRDLRHKSKDSTKLLWLIVLMNTSSRSQIFFKISVLKNFTEISQNTSGRLLLYENGYRQKSIQIRSYFWSVFSCIWIEYRKIRIRNNSVFGHFSHLLASPYCATGNHIIFPVRRNSR